MYPRIIIGFHDDEFVSYIADFKTKNPQFVQTEYSIQPTEKGSITVDQIRELKKELVVRGVPRLITIHAFETATIEAQNAMLKTLEEKSESHQFLLGTHHLGAILPTILSRCTIFYLNNGIQQTEISGPIQELLLAIKQPAQYATLNHALMQVSTPEEAHLVFTQIIMALRAEALTGDARAVGLLKHAIELTSLLHTNNLNPQLAVDTWFLTAKRLHRS